MTFKVTIVLVITMIHRSKTVVIPVHEVEKEIHEEDPQISLATSYIHFHGPVESPEYEVKVPYVVLKNEHNYLSHGQNHHLENQGYAIDYIAHPNYQFAYGVKDYQTGDFHEQKESRNGHSVSGEYSVKEPGGTLRIVSYHADKDGFHAVVHTSGKNDHAQTNIYSHNQQDHVEVQVQDDDHDKDLETEQETHSLNYETSYSVNEHY
ncbi:PREDICTED: uncharacterized protein LOC107064924 [Polistes dominula]|uniref:Uncharacterized protein LOC107064924 n=1 Tax=Polistes dominula TaxID=743375 RepID=A0ABM1I070_POLDO|nr:PREDICTED: uncharacterized protein LOC107064924 [Polistes dominula]